MTTVELCNLIVSSISTILSATAIFLYIVLWYRDKSSNDYDTFDALYLDILKVGLEYPELRSLSYSSNYKNLPENEKIRYESYAFICWNFCETIFDKSDSELMKTWIGVLRTETKLHRQWFEASENKHIFKDEFHAFVQSNFPLAED